MDWEQLHVDLEKVIEDLTEKNRLAPIIVEGEYDRRALRSLGLTGDIRLIHEGPTIFGLCESSAGGHREALILTDWDVRGGRLARQLRDGLAANGVRFDEELRARLTRLCRKDITDVESLHTFVERVRIRRLRTSAARLQALVLESGLPAGQSPTVSRVRMSSKQSLNRASSSEELGYRQRPRLIRPTHPNHAFLPPAREAERPCGAAPTGSVERRPRAAASRKKMNMNIDPSTTKYMIQARMEAEGIVEKPDVVGAVFGQTEGLLGEELDLRDLQKGGRIGRIEVDVQSKKGRSEDLILIPSSLDQVETSILAAALETIDRVGPCKATIKVEKVEDVRVTKRNKIIERAR